jgi:hypothetical protein
MPAECIAKQFVFEAVERRSVVAGFEGGEITSNAGALLLGQVDCGLGLIRWFAKCLVGVTPAVSITVSRRLRGSRPVCHCESASEENRYRFHL